MGVGDHSILCVGKELANTVVDTIDKMVDDESGLISIYYGSDITEDDANELLEMVEEKFEDCDVELNYGGQPVYYYIVSVE